MTESSLAKQDRPESGMTRIRDFMLSPEVKQRFTELMGKNALYYLNQVLILVANSKNLQECEPVSILTSAMRAASLKLSVDPAQGQAWIIPYKDNRTGITSAEFQLGYRGIYELAMRTNLYRVINVIDIYEGETIVEDRMTGMHSITGKMTKRRVIAYMLYFRLANGFEKTHVMTVEEIDAHARRYSRAYNQRSSKWNDPIERPKMERKTVLSAGLRKWGRFCSTDSDILDEIESGHEWIDPGDQLFPDEDKVTHLEPVIHSESDNMAALGFGDGQPTQPKPATTNGNGKQAAPDPVYRSGPVEVTATLTTEENPFDEPINNVDPTPRPPKPIADKQEQVIAHMMAKTSLARPHVVNTLAKCKLPASATLEDFETWWDLYRGERAMKKTSDEAAAFANDTMLNPTPNN